MQIAWLSLFSNLSDTFQFARKNKIGTVVEAKNEYLVEYVWNEKWVVQKERRGFMRNIQIALQPREN